jgi:RimJ/RimL family protein N-acetyltransferase
MADLVFEIGYRKISLSCFAHNNAIKGLLRKLGAVREGVLKDQTTQNGEPVSVELYAIYAQAWQPQQLKNVA